jgi:hypothetical protein
MAQKDARSKWYKEGCCLLFIAELRYASRLAKGFSTGSWQLAAMNRNRLRHQHWQLAGAHAGAGSKARG